MYILEVLAHFDNCMESQPRLFNVKITPVISSMWITDTVRRFQKIILNPSIFTGEPPHLEAQPPLAVAK
jgi:uncharacterized Fe-S cluster protein YjdI